MLYLLFRLLVVMYHWQIDSGAAPLSMRALLWLVVTAAADMARGPWPCDAWSAMPINDADDER